MSVPRILLASSNTQYDHNCFEIYYIFHTCHAPKLEFVYNDNKILFWVIYCAWFQNFYNTAWPNLGILIAFSISTPQQEGSVLTKLAFLLIISLSILSLFWTGVTCIESPWKRTKVQEIQDGRLRKHCAGLLPWTHNYN